jgi:2,3-bisphosphoglycerate-independent phosphoglycerate mutase
MSIQNTINNIAATDGISAVVILRAAGSESSGSDSATLAASWCIDLATRIKGSPVRVNYHTGLDSHRVLVLRDGDNAVAIVSDPGHPVGKSLARLARKALKHAAKATTAIAA